MKRVALLGPSAERYKGGIAQFTSRLADELEQKSRLRFFSWSAMYPRFLLKRDFRDRTSMKATSDSRAEFLLSIVNPLSWLRFVRELRKFNPDIILFTWSHPVHAPVYGVIQWLLGSRHRVRMICHNVAPHETFPGALIMTRRVFRHCDEIIVHGASEQALLQSLVGGAVPILTLFLPLHDFFGERLPRQTGGADLLFFGNIRAYKGLDVLLEAMPQIRKSIPEVKLTIAGELFYSGDAVSDDPALNPLLLIEKLGLQSCVDCRIRYIANEEIPELMSRADICVFPYRSATQSGSVTAALAYGVPVVASGVGGLLDVIVDNEGGTLVSPESPEELANAVIRMLRNPVSESLVSKAAARLSWKKYTAAILAS